MNNRRITPIEVEHSLVNLKQLTFEVTDACNLQCKYCSYGDLYFGYDKRETKYMSFAQGKLLIDYLVDIWKTHHASTSWQRTYISFYGGEPLLNMSFIEKMVGYIERLDVPRNFIYSITTNAMLLDKYMDFLVEKKFNLLISLDGDEKGQSYRITTNGNNSFDKVFSNVKALQQKNPAYFVENVNFNSVLYNRNSVESTHNFIKQEFGKQPTVSELNNSGIKPEKVTEFEKTYKNKIESLMA